MSEYVPAELRRHVRERSGYRCEYCLLHEDDAFLPHEPDHIIAVKLPKGIWLGPASYVIEERVATLLRWTMQP